jgi:hypothetical protein
MELKRLNGTKDVEPRFLTSSIVVVRQALGFK